MAVSVVGFPVRTLMFWMVVDAIGRRFEGHLTNDRPERIALNI
jgi:hypothetical protein